MLKIYLIRHSRTFGNSLKRYIGVTDEPLCEEGIALLQNREYPKAEKLYVSPMLRCRQTAEIIYPGQEYEIVPLLSETNFGVFENKNADELFGTKEYQAWIDSNATMEIPGGESLANFQKRCVRGFEEVVGKCLEDGISSVAFVVHGGTIMAIMDAYAVPHRNFYEYSTANGCGYVVTIDNTKDGIIFSTANPLIYE